MSKITVVGCGLMGSSIINAFLAKGHHVSIVDINEKCLERVKGADYDFHTSIKDAADSKFILLNLPNYDLSVKCINELGVAARGLDIVNTVTMTPDEVGKFAEFLKEKGVNHLESKIECYPYQVGTDNSTFVYSGNYELFTKLQEDLTALSNEPLYLGENIYTSSVIDNVIIGCQYKMLAMFLEQCAFALKYDVPASTVRDIMMPLISDPTIANAEIFEPLKDGILNEYPEAEGAAIEIQKHGLGVNTKALAEAGITTEFNDLIEKYMAKTIEDFGSRVGIVVMANEMYKK